MNLSPLPRQKFFDNNGRPLVGGLLFTYEAGTNNKIDTYSNESGTLNTNPIVLDFRGEANVWLDSALIYKFVLAPATDTDPPTNPIWSVDHIVAPIALPDIWPQTAAEIALGITPLNYHYPPMHVFRYMTATQIADVQARTLTQDVREPFQDAISIAQTSPGGSVYAPAGSYLIRKVAGLDSQFNGLNVIYTNVFGYDGAGLTLYGDGQSTVLCAGDNSMTVIRWSEGNGRLDNLSIDENSKTGITGLSVISQDTSSGASAENIDWNTFSRLSIKGCTEGIELESPAAGGCYYNRFDNIRLYNNTRHIRFRDNATKGGANRNMFVNVSMNSGNCAVYLDGADTNRFIACSAEDITVGSSPLATPTAIYINSAGTLKGFLTQFNDFIGFDCEGCTRDLDCSQRRTIISGGTVGTTGAIAGSANPDFWVGGDHQFWIRELLFGGTAVDSLLVDNRLAAYASANPQIGTSANASGSFPFDNDGSILIQPRQQAASGIQLATGASSTLGLDILGDGSIAARAGSRFTNRIIAVTYSASMTIDASLGNLAEIVANNGTAFTINAPSNPKTGQILTIAIFNVSGGALGAVTWNAIFKLSAWTQPANGNMRAITFYYGGTAWRQFSQTGVDVPN